MTDRTYYIYLHRRADTGEVFYVGKGTRTKKHQYARSGDVTSRNPHWKRIVAKHGYVIDLIADFFIESDAFDLERKLIAEYGLSRNGGALCNLTAGGEGHSGYSPTETTRAKLRTQVSGARHPNYGKRLSAETCRKKSESMKASPYSLRGKKLPAWWKEKIAVTKVGERNPMHGKTGAAHPMSRPVIHTQAGVFYDSIQEAADVFGYKMKTLHNMLSGHRKNQTPLEFA